MKCPVLTISTHVGTSSLPERLRWDAYAAMNASALRKQKQKPSYTFPFIYTSIPTARTLRLLRLACWGGVLFSFEGGEGGDDDGTLTVSTPILDKEQLATLEFTTVQLMLTKNS